MTPLTMTVQSRRLFDGCTAGLMERTAVVEVSLPGGIAEAPRADSDAVFSRIRAAAMALYPQESPALIADTDWPTAFLLPDTGTAVDGDNSGLDPVRRLGNWVIALTVAVQRWACDPVFRGRVVSAEPGRLTLAIPWQRDGLFRDALDLALRLVELTAAPDPDQDALADVRRFLRSGVQSARAYGLAPDTLRLVCAAAKRGIPFEVLPSRTQLGWGMNAEHLDGSFTGRTSVIAAMTARNNVKTSQTLADAGVPVPPCELVGDVQQACGLAETRGWPVVIKTLYQGQGVGATPGISDAGALRRAFDAANEISPGNVVIERHMPGVSHRMLVVHGRLLAVARRPDAGAIGDVAVDIDTEVHPDNRRLAERAARIVGLDIAGVDFITPDPSRSWREVEAAICEVNAQPSLAVHRSADPRRDIDGEVLDLLFAGRPARIPTAAITGTNGKTTTSTMLHHIWLTAGSCAGLSATTGVRVGVDVTCPENLSGQPGARMLLTDPGVEAAVLEMPRKGLFGFGHPCDRYDVGALLNVQDDHIGIDGIDTRQQMAELKAEVLQRATHAAVVNADDPLCLAMRARAGTGRHILVSRDAANPAVGEHRRTGGEAVFLADIDGAPWIVLCAGDRQTPLMPAHAIPATRDGLLRFNQTNAMFAAAMAWAHDIDVDTIASALATFDNTVEQAPGRYNFIDDLPFQLLVDFAHNPDGVREICRIISQLPVTGRRILCSLNLGNHHPDHFDAVAPLLALTFDEFVISRDYEGPDPVEAFLSMTRQFLLDQGVAAEAIHGVAEPAESRRRALSLAGPGDLLVILGRTKSTLPVVDEYRTRMALNRSADENHP